MASRIASGRRIDLRRDARPGRLGLELEAAVQLADVVLSRDAHARRFLLAARSCRVSR